MDASTLNQEEATSNPKSCLPLSSTWGTPMPSACVENDLSACTLTDTWEDTNERIKTSLLDNMSTENFEGSNYIYKRYKNGTPNAKKQRRVNECLAQLVYYDKVARITVSSTVYYRKRTSAQLQRLNIRK